MVGRWAPHPWCGGGGGGGQACRLPVVTGSASASEPRPPPPPHRLLLCTPKRHSSSGPTLPLGKLDLLLQQHLPLGNAGKDWGGPLGGLSTLPHSSPCGLEAPPCRVQLTQHVPESSRPDLCPLTLLRVLRGFAQSKYLSIVVAKPDDGVKGLWPWDPDGLALSLDPAAN